MSAPAFSITGRRQGRPHAGALGKRWPIQHPSSTDPAPAGRILRDPAPPSGAGCLFRAIQRHPALSSGAGYLFRTIQRYPALSSGAGWPNPDDPALLELHRVLDGLIGSIQRLLPSLPSSPSPFLSPFPFLLFSFLPSLLFPFLFLLPPSLSPLPPPRPTAAEKNFGVLDRPWRRWMAQSGRSQRHPAPDPALDRTAGSPLWCWMVLDRPNRADPALIDVSWGIDGNGRVAPRRGPWSLRRGAG